MRGCADLPAVQIQEDYQHNMTSSACGRMRMRVPDQWWGDYLATLAQRGWRARGPGLGARSASTCSPPIPGSVRLQREAMSRLSRAMPKGRVTRTSTHDPFPGSRPRGSHQGDRRGQAGRGDDRGSIFATIPTAWRTAEPQRGCALSAPMVAIFIRLTHRAEERGQLPRSGAPPRRRIAAADPPDLLLRSPPPIADRAANPVQAAIAELADASAWRRPARRSRRRSASSPASQRRALVNEVYLGCTRRPASRSATAG